MTKLFLCIRWVVCYARHEMVATQVSDQPCQTDRIKSVKKKSSFLSSNPI